jgi:hypothetical protein
MLWFYCGEFGATWAFNQFLENYLMLVDNEGLYYLVLLAALICHCLC